MDSFGKKAHRYKKRRQSVSYISLEPIFKKPLDIQKLGRAFLSLAQELHEEKEQKKHDSGGDHETDV